MINLTCSPLSQLVLLTFVQDESTGLALPYLIVFLLARLLVLSAPLCYHFKKSGAQVRPVHALAGQLRRHQRRRRASHRAHRLDEPVRLLREEPRLHGSLMLVRLNIVHFADYPGNVFF